MIISTPSFHEKRRSIRREVKWQAALKDDEQGRTIPAITVNISKHGVLIATEGYFKKPQVISLTVQALIQNKKIVINTMAEVRHVLAKEDFFQLGLLFTEIQPEDQAFLAHFAEGSDVEGIG
ncbi:PilZ domain-containing protein [Endozoicomonas sp. SM1973]|uniref:PilZ domain-containing protein n=1 Tax=Spartinivicinus marinus TaxID=2994442 RepID=A0A853IGK3_9GAMM|nr:PilZ domain-containing protein [Spartinivicinus marinus]MCX4027998.1 PilZ domain-containing protein [Spartinivicinus marinus]NYZ68275.1 PilZ domain-containing protein [Spartinivicinus marinus]